VRHGGDSSRNMDWLDCEIEEPYIPNRNRLSL
jgi:hypothetical protein